jgi:hypothetical protein
VNGSRPKRLIRPILVLVVAPILLLVLVANQWGLIGLGGYIILVFAVIVWNFAALFRAMTNRLKSFRGLLYPQNLSIVVAYGAVFIIWGLYVMELWSDDRPWHATGHAIATAIAAVALLTDHGTRRLRNYLIVVYNLLGTLAVGAWAAADAGGSGGGLLLSTAQGWGILQTLLFSWGAYFAPIFFLPPLLVFEKAVRKDETADQEVDVTVDPKTEVVGFTSSESRVKDEEGPGIPGPKRGLVRRASSVGMDMALGGFVVMLLLFSAIGAVNIASWQDLPDPDEASYTSRDDFEFAAMGRAFTDRRDPTASWETVVQSEIDHAVDLGLDYIRYDLHKELIDDEKHLKKLDMAVEGIRAAGLDVMLSPFGSNRWEADHPSFEELSAEIDRETLLLVERYEPAWVLPFFEPNGQVAVNLGEMAPVEDWVIEIDAVGKEVRSLSNHTKVLIEVAMEPEQGTDLVDALSAPGLAIDAIGVDLYPLSAEVLDDLEEYRDHATNPSIGFWVSEFGVESVLSGQEGQARALSSVISRATGELNGTGICVWALLDDTVLPSNLGIVGRDGTPKEAYRVLKDAIEKVRSD